MTNNKIPEEVANSPPNPRNRAMIELSELIERWNSGDGKPYKGSLIDWRSFKAQPDNIGCMCAQGQALHLLGGWSPQKLRDTTQEEADRETAKLLGISVAHAILLRNVNDSVDGAPSIVLTNPEKVLGDQAHIVLAFWRHLDRMTAAQWATTWTATMAVEQWATTWTATWTAEQWAATRAVEQGSTTWTAAANASAEIQGARLLRGQGKPFFFLPMFGFADPEAVLAADEAARTQSKEGRDA